MDIRRYHSDHATILQQIETLRALSRIGIRENAEKIGEAIVSTASHIKFHLVAEDQVLYPRLAKSGTPEVRELSARYQAEMRGIAAAFGDFVNKWRVPARLKADPEGFRYDANTVLRALYERLRREDVELYPVAEEV